MTKIENSSITNKKKKLENGNLENDNLENEIIDKTDINTTFDSDQDYDSDESNESDETDESEENNEHNKNINKSLDKQNILFGNSLISKETVNNINDNNTKSDIIINGVYDSIEDIADSLKNVQLELKSLYKKFGNLKKDYTKVITIKNKLENKKKKQKQKLQCGFVKPRPISIEMCIFLKIEEGTLLGRNEVTKKLNEYIVLNNLRSETDRRIILPNLDLRKILGIAPDDNSQIISYFNLQSYLKRHFI
jgi:chromatin remodeling complex protein RSC6